MKSNFDENELIELFSEVGMNEALYISSSSLVEELMKYKKEELFTEKRKEKLILSLLKYALRIHNRCTPFGLFSGCKVIKFSNRSEVVFNNQIERRTHLDTSVLCHIIKSINEVISVRDKFLFYPNNSILKAGNKIRYTEFSYVEDKRVYNVASVDHSFYLNKILEASINGLRKLDLVDLVSGFDIERDDAEGFIELLIQNQILVSELELYLTEESSSLEAIIHKLKGLSTNVELETIVNLLETILQKLQILDHDKANETNQYLDLKQVVSQITNSFDQDHFVHVDITPGCNENSSLDTQIQDQILLSIEILHRLNSSPEEKGLKEFKTKFNQRYEDQEVPLLTVLDPEIGIGYGSTENRNSGIHPIVDDLFIAESSSKESMVRSNEKLSFLKKITIDSIKSDKYCIDLLAEKDVIMSFDKKNSLPASFSVVFNLLRDESGKDVVQLNYTCGTSAANIFGRFTEDIEIGSLVAEIFEKESFILENDSILAEIVHLPQDRIGNVTRRYKSREWEIPYISRGSVDQNHQIHLHDLLVSVRNDKVILRSTKHNKLILPRLCNFHNFHNNSLPVYHFLCDLSFQGVVPGLFLSLSDLGLNLPFYPRVTIGDVIVSRATWQLSKSEIDKVFKSTNCEQEIQTLIKKLKLPVTFFIVEGDNELLIDTKSNLSIKLLISEIRNKQEVIIKENLYQNINNSIVRNEENEKFSSEFIASIINNSNTIVTGIDTKAFLNRAGYYEKLTEQRIFPPGSEWFYFKIYCGNNTSDEILSEVIREIVSVLSKEELILKWFFIRYSDSGDHLRVRFNLVSTEVLGKVLNIVHKLLKDSLESGVIWNFQIDTYTREIERYGNAVSVSEELFYYDSEAIINFLAIADNYPENNILMKFALQGIYDLMESFSFNNEVKVSMIQKLKSSFFEEFGAGKTLKKGLDKKIREYRDEMDNLRNKSMFPKDNSIANLLFERKQKFQVISNKLDEILNREKSVVSKEELAFSYIHMFMNRLFNGKQRMHELVIYYLLAQVYRTEQILQD